MQIIVIGKNGQVSTSLVLELERRKIPFLNYGRAILDLEDSNSIKSFLESLEFKEAEGKKIIINAAAYTNVEKAEDEFQKAVKINSEANKILADYTYKNNILLVNYSTDYVFNGNKSEPYIEADPTDPINSYGKSKLMGENAIRSITDNFLILRTSWVFSHIGTNFVKKIYSLLKSQKEIKVIDDQKGCPTSSRFIADATISLIDKYKTTQQIAEVINIAQPGPISWYGFANSISSLIKESSKANIISVSSDEFQTKAKRPKNSVLSNTKLKNILSLKEVENWYEDLKRVIKVIENE
jgi:dTDP-4-dehydrorhamnose reductase